MPLRGKRLLVVHVDDTLAAALSAAAIGAGATVSLCRGGRAAIEDLDATRADGALVELPLRDVRGDAFLIALRDRGVSCVAVSRVLTGQRYADVARQLGAAAFFERPFHPEVVVAALAADMAERDAEAIAITDAKPLRGAEAPAGSNANATSNATLSPSPPGPADAAGVDVDPDFDSLIFSAARPALDECVPVSLFAQPAEGLAAPLPPGAEGPRRPAAAPPLPEGDLAATRVPRLAAYLHAQRASGALTLAHGPVKVVFGFDGGRLVLAASNVASQRFGARLVRAGVLSPAALDALAAEIGPEGRVGETLVARGILAPDERARLVAEQVRDIVWSTLGWRDGSYRLAAAPVHGRALVPLDLDLGALLLEGLARTATLAQLRADLPAELALAPTPSPAFELHRLDLADAQAALLALADGTKTVADLVALARLPEREALALLLASRELGILAEVPRVLAGTRRIGFM